MESPLTKSELIEVLNMFIVPFYQIIGGIIAILMFGLFYWVFIHPIVKRIK